MQSCFTNSEIEERNAIILDILSAAKGKEVHITDLAFLLHLDPHQADCWMRQHGFGKWINGKNGHCWRGLLVRMAILNRNHPNEDYKSMDGIACLE